MSTPASPEGVGPRQRGTSGVLGARTGGASTLTAAEIGFLAEHGGVPAEAITSPDLRRSALEERERATQAAWESVLASSLTTAGVTARFGWSSSKVSRLIRDRDLFTITGVGPRRMNMFPTWQFTETGVMPGLRHVLAHLPADWHPADVEQWMSTPNENVPHGRTPIAWLAEGLDADAVVAALVSDLVAW